MSYTSLQNANARVPRYTSYPTAPHFHDGVTAGTYERWLREIRDGEPLSLYLHIPYCQSLCWYCGCHTKATRRYQPVADYAQVLKVEISRVARTIESRPLVTHIHWGGGTPTILEHRDLQDIMATLRNGFQVSEQAEIAIEIDPRYMDQAKAETLAAMGVTRASLGVQDCNPTVQAAINRIQPFEQTADAIANLRAVGIDQINLDLMYGLPHQSISDARRTVDLVLGLKPDRLAVFGYAHVPWMKSHQKMIDDAALPDESQRLEQAQSIARDLMERGYRRIGLDHFARLEDPLCQALNSGQLHRNFQGYTTDRAETLLGFGASAIGALRQGYVQNRADFAGYARAVRDDGLAIQRGIELNDDDRLRRAVIERLMCDMAVDLETVSQQEGADSRAFSLELEQLRDLADDDCVVIEDCKIEVTEKGRPWIRLVCAVFDRYLSSGQARHSVAV